ncbi:MAG: long-chain fatty acid--CoA ligase [Intrasporangium sp.]|uniref:acyl-CoA synthetase n=1 Tax=Intrasporangium sp. TaxID=1925024 RepID=UPI002647B188|nr:long-chain fatty acid--CoA ligase [Intrasporangium sp.]MDN5794774.1 long-chain fatty acid--CoA ligase [Intrasporangium sp.]
MDHGYGNWVTVQSVRNGDRAALIDATSGAVTTYRDLDASTNRLADALSRKGVRRGDRVAMLTLNSPQMMEIYLAAAKLGAIGVPVNFRLSPREVAYVLGDSGAIVLFSSSNLAATVEAALTESPSVRHHIAIPTAAERAAGDGGDYEALLATGSPERVVRDVAETDVCVIMYTSGTTGLPKGAMLTHRNFFYNAINCFGFGSGIGRDDVTVSAAPLFHIGALGVHTLPFLYIGACTVITETFTPGGWLEAAEKYRITKAFNVPAMWAAIAQALPGSGRDLSSLTFAVAGGAPCPIPVIRALQGQGMAFTEGFGLTETSPIAACLAPEDVLEHAGSIGRPVNHNEFRILDEEDHDVPVGAVGELCIQGPNVFVGYWDRPGETAQALRGGWFHTGDMARVDDDGFYTLVDRKKDMVITGGENVYPIEVEKVLYEHPDVTEVAVIGVPDEQWGEHVTAVVVVRSESTLTPEGLREWTRERVAHFKAPREVHFIDELPRTATGKILKRRLRETFSGTSSQVTR